MAKKIAIAVIHGMGKQKKDKEDPSSYRTFSQGMYSKLLKVLGMDVLAQAAWREIYWQDALQDRQQKYFDKLDFPWTWRWPRKFVMYRLSDAGSYRKTDDKPGNSYGIIHDRVRKVMQELEDEVEPDAPLLIIAHSLGAAIISNHIYDLWPYDVVKATGNGGSTVKYRKKTKPAFGNMGTLARFFTFGCNIPVFVFAYKPEDIKPIRPPVSANFKPGNPPWWVNHYDKVDALGYPLRPIGGQ